MPTRNASRLTTHQVNEGFSLAAPLPMLIRTLTHTPTATAINIATTTPIDDETCVVRFNFMVRKFEDERMTSTVAEAFVKEINKQIVEDKPIWEHKTFLPVPALADTDGPILKFRKWYSQFYAEGVPAGA